MGSWIQDVRFGIRSLAKRPGFTLIAILTLALGIGANTTIFSVLNAVLLRPLPYRDPAALVLVRERIPKLIPGPIPVSAPDILQFEKQNRVFESVGGYDGIRMDLSGQQAPQRIDGLRATASLFPTLGVAPLMGRTFTPAEDQPGQRLVVIAYGFWQRLGADPNIIGQTISLDRQPYTVIGVMPKAFQFPMAGIPMSASHADFWLPMGFTKDELAHPGDNFDFGLIARLKPGVTIQRANEDVSAIARRIQETYPSEIRKEIALGALVLPLHDQVTGGVRPLLLILWTAVGFVLLIACANVANLLLSRAAERNRELAIRSALGAGRFRVIRQMFTESLILSMTGAALGVLLAFWGTDAAIHFAGTRITRLPEASIDPATLGFSVFLSLATALLFGAYPAFAASRADLNQSLRESGKSTAGLRRNRVRSILIVAEVALAMVLLIGAGLLIRSFVTLRNTDLGFRTQNLITLGLSLPSSNYEKAGDVRGFYGSLTQRLGALPGVEAVGAATDLPWSGTNWHRIFSAEGDGGKPAGKPPLLEHTVVMGDYLQAIGIPLKRGRYFSSQDRQGSPGVVLINEKLAKQFWPGQDPVGKRIKWGTPQSKTPWVTIVGVVGDAREGSLDKAIEPHTYESWAQANDDAVKSDLARTLQWVALSSGDPANLSKAVRAEVAALDRELPIANLSTIEQSLDSSLSPRMFNTSVVCIFASIALLMAGLGIYGIVSYSVTQRTQEIGVRVALGAGRNDVLRSVIAQGFVLTLIGVAVGIAGALALTGFMSNLLFGIAPTDPLTFTVLALFLIAVSLAASWIPARRALSVDPMVALRYE